jgi:outer membrane protein
MKKLFFILVLLLTCVFNAQAADMKIGFVDLNKALNESEKGKNATEALENMVKSKKSVLIEKEKELKILDDELKKQASVLTPESMKSKTEEFNKLYKNYQRMKFKRKKPN